MRTILGTTAIAMGLILQGATVTAQTGETPRTEANPGTSTPAEAVSQVRIVRLSQVHGVVQLDRNTGRGYEGAFANIPIVQGSRLRTGQGVAEVEFEDNSTLRLVPDSEAVFVQLGRTATGSTLTTVDVTRGVAYASFGKAKGDAYTLTDGRTKILLGSPSHVRLEANGPKAELAVFEGQAQVIGPASPQATVTKKQALVFDPADQGLSTLARNAEEETYDAWDRNQQQYHQQRATLTGTGGAGLYGANDLNYYGQFVDMPGCGSMWRPYFASAAWDPFANGMWAYYQTAGYSWVSPYPWGWLPFHSGSWASCGNSGWGWRPGGSWYSLANQAVLTGPKRPVAPVLPKDPKEPVRATLVPVNTRPLTMSGVSAPGTFTFRKDSAGLGVPRESFGKLSGASNTVEHHGAANSSMSSAFNASTSLSGSSSLQGLPGREGQTNYGGASRGSSTSSSSASHASVSSGSMSGGSMHSGSMSSGSMSSGSMSSGSMSNGASAASSGGGHH